MKPRTPASAPDTPTITFPSRASGARVRENPIALSATSTSQRTAPDLASSATRWASSVPTYSVESRMATPRFTRGKPMLSTLDPISGDHVHSRFPVRASSAVTVLGGSVTYMTPSATTGLVSMSPSSIW